MSNNIIGNVLDDAAAENFGDQGQFAGASIPPALNPTDFIAIAKGASCANLRNRLFVIDQKHVFWDKASSYPDASFSQVLYGNSPQIILCSSADSILGPRTFYNDEDYRALFQIIVKNLNKPDLGLDNRHQVQQLTVPQASSEAIASKIVQFYDN
jgi:hypothetical protein